LSVASETQSAESARHRVLIHLAQACILSAFLAWWQWAPSISALRAEFKFLDPYFISSPQLVAVEIKRLLVGGAGITPIWSALGTTLAACLIGTLIGGLLGLLAGLLLSNYKNTREIVMPFLMVLNTIPRIALIPIIVIIEGPTAASTSISCITLVFFVVFFNAFEGGRGISPELIQSARLLDATTFDIVFRVRLRYVAAWSFVAIPNAISYGIIGGVTAEILTGSNGIGSVLTQALSTANSTLTVAVVIILAAVSGTAIALASMLRGRLLHWWAA
jgi:NitT/TauT family transport system permease protein